MSFNLPPPPPPSVPPPAIYEMIANFYVSKNPPPPIRGVVNIKLPPPEEWVDHQAIIYKVRRYLLSKNHPVRVNPDGRWCIYDRTSNEIESLLQWCYLTRTVGIFAADDIMLHQTPYVFSDPVPKEIFGIVDPDHTLSLGLLDKGQLGKQCTFLCNVYFSSSWGEIKKSNLKYSCLLLAHPSFET